MTNKDQTILKDLKDRIPADLRHYLRAVIAYGSRARGDASEDSDLDIAILVTNKTPSIEKRLDELAYQVMWEHDFKPVISLKVFSEKEFETAYRKGFSFYRHIRHEGILV